MTDAKYVYTQDMKERTSVARGAHGKKGKVFGPKGMKGPSDYLTKSQKRALNGPVSTYSMNKLYTCSEFQAFPDNIQVEYLNHLIDTYGVTLQRISSDLFDRSHAFLQNYLSRKGIVSQIHSQRGRKMKAQDIARWEDAILRSIDPEYSSEPVQESTSQANTVSVTSSMKSITATFSELDVEFLKSLRSCFGENVRVTVTIEYAD